MTSYSNIPYRDAMKLSPLGDFSPNPVSVEVPGSNPLLPFFGPPSNRFDEVGAQDLIPRETLTRPEAYDQQSYFLGSTIDYLITKKTEWPMIYLMPWRHTDQYKIGWNTWFFDRTLVEPEPELAPPRIITERKESHSASLQRHGIGLIISDDFWRTAEGVMSLVMGVLNIRQAVITTVIEEIWQTLLYGKQYYLERLRRYRGPHPTVASAFMFSNWRWGLVQKDTTGNGLVNIIQAYKSLMKAQQVEPNIIVGTAGMARQVMSNPEKRRYDKVGPNATRNLEQGENVMLDNTFQGLPYFEASPNEVDFLDGVHHPLTRNRQIGNFYKLYEFNPQQDPRKYITDQRSTFIPDMSTPDGGFSKITLQTCLQNCGRFDASGNLRREHLEMLQKLESKIAQTKMEPPDGLVDMMVVKDQDAPNMGPNAKTKKSKGYRLVRFNGEMEIPYARMEDIDKLAQSADASASREGLTPEIRGDVESGMELAENLYKVDLFDRNQRAYMYAVARQNDLNAGSNIRIAPDPLNVGSADVPYYIDPVEASSWVAGGLQGAPASNAVKYLSVRDQGGRLHRVVHLRPFNFSAINFPARLADTGLLADELNSHHPGLDQFVLENELRTLLLNGTLYPSALARGADAAAALFNYLLNPANNHVIVGPTLPYGFCAFSGMFALAKLSQNGAGTAGTRNYDPAVLIRARKYVHGIAKHADIFIRIFPNNPMMAARYCPYMFRTRNNKAADGLCTYADGMFGPNRLPVFLKSSEYLQEELLLELGNPNVTTALLSGLRELASNVPELEIPAILPEGITRADLILDYRQRIEDWRDQVLASETGRDPEIAAEIRTASDAVIARLSGVAGTGNIPAAAQERPIPQEIVDAMVSNVRRLSRFPRTFDSERLANALRLLYTYGSQELADTLPDETKFKTFVHEFNSGGQSLGANYYRVNELSTSSSGKNMFLTFLLREVLDPLQESGLKNANPNSAANLLSYMLRYTTDPESGTPGDMSESTLDTLRGKTIQRAGIDVDMTDVVRRIRSGDLTPPENVDPAVWAHRVLRETLEARVRRLTQGRRADDAAISPESGSLQPRYFMSRLCIDPDVFHRLADELEDLTSEEDKRALYRQISLALPMNRENPREPLGLARRAPIPGTIGASRLTLQQETNLASIAYELRSAQTMAPHNDDIYHAPIGVRNLGSAATPIAGAKRGASSVIGGAMQDKRQRTGFHSHASYPPDKMMEADENSPFVSQEMHGKGRHFHFAKNAVIRWAAASEIKNLWTRVAAQLWIVEPVHYTSFAAKLRYNVKILVDFLLEQPFQEYVMGSIILARGGASLGHVWYGNENFMWADNASVKVHLGHFTMNWKPIIHDWKSYIVITDAYGVGYVGGEDTTFFSPETFNPLSSTLHKQGSIFCFMEPVNSIANVREIDRHRFGVLNPHDITGHWNPAVVGPLLSTENEVDYKKPHHPSAFYYNQLYNLEEIFPKDPLDDLYFNQPYVAHVNTVVYQGMQWIYSLVANAFVNVILNTGPWGPDIYAGVKRARTGMETYIEKQDYGDRVIVV